LAAACFVTFSSVNASPSEGRKNKVGMIVLWWRRSSNFRYWLELYKTSRL
jgi:hypothetical protein